eukprot:scaffold270842_cov28-Tisochrysis_lutea.AAC.1
MQERHARRFRFRVRAVVTHFTATTPSSTVRQLASYLLPSSDATATRAGVRGRRLDKWNGLAPASEATASSLSTLLPGWEALKLTPAPARWAMGYAYI